MTKRLLIITCVSAFLTSIASATVSSCGLGSDLSAACDTGVAYANIMPSVGGTVYANSSVPFANLSNTPSVTPATVSSYANMMAPSYSTQYANQTSYSYANSTYANMPYSYSAAQYGNMPSYSSSLYANMPLSSYSSLYANMPLLSYSSGIYSNLSPSSYSSSQYSNISYPYSYPYSSGSYGNTQIYGNMPAYSYQTAYANMSGYSNGNSQYANLFFNGNINYNPYSLGASTATAVPAPTNTVDSQTAAAMVNMGTATSVNGTVVKGSSSSLSTFQPLVFQPNYFDALDAPEPTSILLAGAGLLALAMFKLRTYLKN